MSTDQTPRNEVDGRTPMQAQMMRGHLMRTGHELTGYYGPTDHPGIVQLIRTCACATGNSA